MNRLLRYFLFAAVLCLFPGVPSVLARFESEITVYMLSCDAEQIDGICKGKEKTDMPLTYKVSVDQHSVSFWPMDDPGRSRSLSFCAIHDAKSWLCQWSSDDAPKTRFGMEAGKYVEIATCMTDTSTPDFYQVPVWRWWLAWLSAKLFPDDPPSAGQFTRKSSGHG